MSISWAPGMVYMSIVDLPDMKMYWSKDEFYGNFIVEEVLPRDRFEKISQFFHRDKLHLIHPIIDHVNAECVAAYNPHKEVTVDEAMNAFRGRLSLDNIFQPSPLNMASKCG